MGASGASNFLRKAMRFSSGRVYLNGIQPPSWQWSCRLRHRKHQRCSALLRTVLGFLVVLRPFNTAGFFCVSHAASSKETFGMMLRGDVRRPRPRLFSQLLAGFSSGMPCRALVSKRVQGVQHSRDTAVPTAQACWDTYTEPTKATVRKRVQHVLFWCWLMSLVSAFGFLASCT